MPEVMSRSGSSRRPWPDLDYLETVGSMIFVLGEPSKTVEFEIFGDYLNEIGEDFSDIATSADAMVLDVPIITIRDADTGAPPVRSQDFVYTLDEDFDFGTFVTVNHTLPNNNQLAAGRAATPCRTTTSRPPLPHDCVRSVAAVTATLGDCAWLDRNRDGIQDTTEPGIAEVRANCSTRPKHHWQRIRSRVAPTASPTSKRAPTP